MERMRVDGSSSTSLGARLRAGTGGRPTVNLESSACLLLVALGLSSSLVRRSLCRRLKGGRMGGLDAPISPPSAASYLVCCCCCCILHCFVLCFVLLQLSCRDFVLCTAMILGSSLVRCSMGMCKCCLPSCCVVAGYVLQLLFLFECLAVLCCVVLCVIVSTVIGIKY